MMFDAEHDLEGGQRDQGHPCLGFEYPLHRNLFSKLQTKPVRKPDVSDNQGDGLRDEVCGL